MYTGLRSWCCATSEADGACLVPKLSSISIFKYKSGKFPPNLLLQVSTLPQQLDVPPSSHTASTAWAQHAPLSARGAVPWNTNASPTCTWDRNATHISTHRSFQAGCAIEGSHCCLLPARAPRFCKITAQFENQLSCFNRTVFHIPSHCNKESQYHLSNYSHRAMKMFSNNLICLLFAGECHNLKYF